MKNKKGQRTLNLLVAVLLLLGTVLTGITPAKAMDTTALSEAPNLKSTAFSADLALYAQLSAQPSVVYELATTIEKNETYLVVAKLTGGYFAMNSDIYSGTQNLKSTPVTVEGNLVTTAVDSKMLWDFVEGSTGNAFSIYNNPAGYIRRGSSGNGLQLVQEVVTTYTDWNHNATANDLYNISTGGPGGGTTNYYLKTATSAGTTYFTHGTSAVGNIYFYKQKTVVTEPVIEITSAMTAFSAPVGENSAVQSYTVSGTNLNEGIVVTAPTNFQVSLSEASGFGTSVTLPVGGGTVYVRFMAPSTGNFSGEINHESGDAASKTLAVSAEAYNVYTLSVTDDGKGSVTLNPPTGPYKSGTTVTLTPNPNSGHVFKEWTGANAADVDETGGVYTIKMDANKTLEANFEVQLCSTVTLIATEDTYISAYNKDFNYGGVNPLKVTNFFTSVPNRGALLKWDLSGIPAEATISSASMELYVSNAGAKVYNLYNMRQAWVEGNNTSGAASLTSANWNTYDGENDWGTPGAASIETDRYDQNMWGADADTFASPGSKSVPLNANGIAAVQGWINGDNFGVTIQNYAASGANDDLQISSSENSTEAQRPKLVVTYCIPPEKTEIEAVAITEIDLPAAGGIPDTQAVVAATPGEGIDSSTAVVTWSPTDSPFDYATVYTASVTLSAAEGYEFTDGTTATVNEQTATTVTLKEDGTLTVTYTFPITGEAPLTTITAVAISEIIAPVAQATPDAEAAVTATPPAGITGTTAVVTWDPDDSAFKYATVYKASVTLTAAEGYVFTAGTAATVNGLTATTVTLNEDGTLTVTYAFPATEAESQVFTIFLPLIFR